jgi:phosphopantetheine--protein transferase-like protein
MLSQTLVEYLCSLLNRPVTAADRVDLSSAQRARLIGWLENQGAAPAAWVIPRSFEVGQLARQLGEPPTQEGAAPLPSIRPALGGAPEPSGVGIDIQSVSELISSAALKDLKGDPELRALFTPREMSYAECRSDPRETLAGIFAAKEAIRKADAAMLQRPFTQIEILPDEQGAPRIAGFAISISHSAGVAIAIAIARAVAPAAQAPASAATSLTRQPSLTALDPPPVRERRVARAAIVAVLLLSAGAAGLLWLHGLIH